MTVSVSFDMFLPDKFCMFFEPSLFWRQGSQHGNGGGRRNSHFGNGTLTDFTSIGLSLS